MYYNYKLFIYIFKRLTQVSANAKAIDLVSLLIETQYGVLVDIIRRHNGQLVKPWNLEAFRHLLEGFPRQAR